MRYVCGVLLAALLGCGGDAPRGPAPADELTLGDAGPRPTVSYARDVAPIFRAKCVACHYPDAPTLLDLTRPFDEEQGLVNRKNSWTDARHAVLVVPGSPEKSALIDKVSATDLDFKTEGSFMPLVIEPLTADERATVKQWIEDGAKNDAFFAEQVARIFGDGETLGRKFGKCAVCHSGRSAFEPDLVNPFDPQRGVVGVEASVAGVGGVRVKPGDAEGSVLWAKVAADPPADVGAPMPKRYEKLSDDEVATLETWIREGALDN